MLAHACYLFSREIFYPYAASIAGPMHLEDGSEGFEKTLHFLPFCKEKTWEACVKDCLKKIFPSPENVSRLETNGGRLQVKFRDNTCFHYNFYLLLARGF